MQGFAKTVLAVVSAGAVGTLANAAAAALLISSDKLALATVPGRYGVAIAVAALLPFVLRAVRGVVGMVLALVLLTAVPSLIAKFVLAAGAPWAMVLLLNGVYAVAAIAVFRGLLPHHDAAEASRGPAARGGPQMP